MNSAKEPWLAVLLSLVWIGTGHIYLGRKYLGLTIATSYLVLVVITFSLASSATANSLYPLLLAPMLLLAQLFTIVHAFILTRRNNSAEFEQTRRSLKDPWLAVLLSVLLPGLGYIYIGSWALGIGSFVLVVITSAFMLALPTFFPPLFLPEIASFVIALSTYRATLAIRPSSVRNPARLLAAVFLAICLLITSLKLFRSHIAEPFVISGKSMSPALQPGDRILVSKRFDRNLPLGALIIYENADNHADWIKRVVALPGDRVEIRDDNRMYINDAPLAVAPFADATFEKNPLQPTSYWKVPQGHVFVLGDNPARSLDSRSHGPVEIRSVRGVAYKIWWPLDRSGPIK